MLDLFRQLKLEYSEYILLFKSGSFYISFDEDSVILNKLFNYKMVELKNNIKVGFPINKLDMIINRLETLNINYIIVEDYTIKNEKEFDINNFNNYRESVFNIISINNRINKIVNKLKNIDSRNINEILDRIENIIN